MRMRGTRKRYWRYVLIVVEPEPLNPNLTTVKGEPLISGKKWVVHLTKKALQHAGDEREFLIRRYDTVNTYPERWPKSSRPYKPIKQKLTAVPINYKFVRVKKGTWALQPTKVEE